MIHILTYATAHSRLHADLAVVRLHKAGIATAQISIMHPPLARPNSALWLNGSSEFALSEGESVLVSGFLSSWLDSRAESDETNSLVEELVDLGVGRSQSIGIEDSLLERRVVVAIAEWDERKVPAILECLQDVGAECIRQADIDDRKTRPAYSLRRARRTASPIAQALAIGGRLVA
jgi:hypothetical protein